MLCFRRRRSFHLLVCVWLLHILTANKFSLDLLSPPCPFWCRPHECVCVSVEVEAKGNGEDCTAGRLNISRKHKHRKQTVALAGYYYYCCHVSPLSLLAGDDICIYICRINISSSPLLASKNRAKKTATWGKWSDFNCFHISHPAYINTGWLCLFVWQTRKGVIQPQLLHGIYFIVPYGPLSLSFWILSEQDSAYNSMETSLIFELFDIRTGLILNHFMVHL